MSERVRIAISAEKGWKDVVKVLRNWCDKVESAKALPAVELLSNDSGVVGEMLLLDRKNK